MKWDGKQIKDQIIRKEQFLAFPGLGNSERTRYILRQAAELYEVIGYYFQENRNLYKLKSSNTSVHQSHSRTRNETFDLSDLLGSLSLS